MKVHVQTLENAHRDVCALVTVNFEARSSVSVRDVLLQLQQDPVGVQVLLWGEDELQLDDVATDGDFLIITDQAAERLRQMNRGREESSRRERDRLARELGIVPQRL